MAEEPSKPTPSTPVTPPDTNSKPVANDDGQPRTGPAVEATPLADGTVPTVLATGDGSHPGTDAATKRGKARLGSVYRRADILTTLITFVGAAVTAGIILGIYAYLNRSQTPTISKPTALDQVELDKLKAFFQGNSAGTPAEILTITSSTFFKNRAAFASDTRIVGGLQVSGPTALSDLTVDKTTTLGITNVRGQLTVSGPTAISGATTIANSLTVNGNVTSAGNGSFAGSISAGTLNVRDISVSGTFNINGHINIGGQLPSAATGIGAGSGATATVSGNDSAGTVTINTGTVINNSNLGGPLVTVTFKNPFPAMPVVIITPNGRGSALLNPYTIKTATGFTVGAAVDPASTTSYSFDYWVVQ